MGTTLRVYNVGKPKKVGGLWGWIRKKAGAPSKV